MDKEANEKMKALQTCASLMVEREAGDCFFPNLQSTIQCC
jgi:hypothetical protein